MRGVGGEGGGMGEGEGVTVRGVDRHQVDISPTVDDWRDVLDSLRDWTERREW